MLFPSTCDCVCRRNGPECGALGCAMPSWMGVGRNHMGSGHRRPPSTRTFPAPAATHTYIRSSMSSALVLARAAARPTVVRCLPACVLFVKLAGLHPAEPAPLPPPPRRPCAPPAPGSRPPPGRPHARCTSTPGSPSSRQRQRWAGGWLVWRRRRRRRPTVWQRCRSVAQRCRQASSLLCPLPTRRLRQLRWRRRRLRRTLRRRRRLCPARCGLKAAAAAELPHAWCLCLHGLLLGVAPAHACA